MKVFRAVGFGLLLLILQFMVPQIFNEFEETLVLFFDTTQAGLEVTKSHIEDTPPELFQ